MTIYIHYPKINETQRKLLLKKYEKQIVKHFGKSIPNTTDAVYWFCEMLERKEVINENV